MRVKVYVQKSTPSKNLFNGRQELYASVGLKSKSFINETVIMDFYSKNVINQRYMFRVPCTAGKKYTISMGNFYHSENPSSAGLLNRVWIGYTDHQDEQKKALYGNDSVTVTPTENYIYVKCYVAWSSQFKDKDVLRVTIQNLQIEEGSTATEYEPYGNYQRVKVWNGKQSKNLIPYPYRETTKTMNGITFTDNGDGSITINGKNDGIGNSAFHLIANSVLQAGTYKGSVGYTGIDLIIHDKDNTYRNVVATTYTIDSQKNINLIYLQIRRGDTTVYNNVTVYPMLNIGSTAAEYEPYNQARMKVHIKE